MSAGKVKNMSTADGSTATYEGTPLRLSFEPDAIIEHFEVDEESAAVINSLTEQDLALIGYLALTNAALYKTFNEVLCNAVLDVTGKTVR